MLTRQARSHKAKAPPSPTPHNAIAMLRMAPSPPRLATYPHHPHAPPKSPYAAIIPTCISQGCPTHAPSAALNHGAKSFFWHFTHWDNSDRNLTHNNKTRKRALFPPFRILIITSEKNKEEGISSPPILPQKRVLIIPANLPSFARAPCPISPRQV